MLQSLQFSNAGFISPPQLIAILCLTLGKFNAYQIRSRKDEFMQALMKCTEGIRFLEFTKWRWGHRLIFHIDKEQAFKLKLDKSSESGYDNLINRRIMETNGT